MDLDAYGGYEKPAAEADRRGKHGFAWARFLQPFAKHCGGKPQEDDGEAEDPSQIGKFPIEKIRAIHAGQRLHAATGCLDLNQVIQRLFENAESISLADRQVDGKSGRWN